MCRIDTFGNSLAQSILLQSSDKAFFVVTIGFAPWKKKYGNPGLHYVASFSHGWLFLSTVGQTIVWQR
jgi:hypothetical protein